MNTKNIDLSRRTKRKSPSSTQARAPIVRRLPWLLVPTSALLACGPAGSSDGSYDDGYDDFGSADGIGGSPVSAGGGVSVGGAESEGVGGSAVGGAGASVGYCDTIQPQQTYICNGWAFESEETGAASLTIIPEYCSDPSGSGGAGTGGVGTGGMATGGAATGGAATGGLEGVGGNTCTSEECQDLLKDEAPVEKYVPDEGYGYGGEPYGVGGSGYPGAGGATSVGGGPSGGWELGQRWCDTDPPNSVSGGISFAVGPCQDVDVAQPLLFREPYGEYQLTIYGSYSACERGFPLATAAGLGTGELLEIPFSNTGYFNFISVEVKAAPFSDFGIRLRDRPRVVPTASGEY